MRWVVGEEEDERMHLVAYTASSGFSLPRRSAAEVSEKRWIQTARNGRLYTGAPQRWHVRHTGTLCYACGSFSEVGEGPNQNPSAKPFSTVPRIAILWHAPSASQFPGTSLFAHMLHKEDEVEEFRWWFSRRFMLLAISSQGQLTARTFHQQALAESLLRGGG